MGYHILEWIYIHSMEKPFTIRFGNQHMFELEFSC